MSIASPSWGPGEQLGEGLESRGGGGSHCSVLPPQAGFYSEEPRRESTSSLGIIGLGAEALCLKSQGLPEPVSKLVSPGLGFSWGEKASRPFLLC